MNYSAFVPAPQSRGQGLGLNTEKRGKCKTYSLRMLRECVRQELPLDVHVSATTVGDEFVQYDCLMTSLTSKKTWHVAYRYSEFLAFRGQVEEVLTCRDPKCSGSCQAIRDYVSACFPKKRLAALSMSVRTVADRKHKFENVLLHLLRCVLLPGSAMKCFHARQQLPPSLFAFLGVSDAADQRSLLQVFVDNYQSSARRGASEVALLDSFHSNASTVDSVDASQCMICLEDVDLEARHSCCSEKDGDAEDEAEPDAASQSVVLPCEHAFHRECIFEWLLFEFHCPVCRKRVGPDAVTNYCRAKNQVQWWLGDFDEDPLRPATA